jgi:hypothetical protein
MHRRLLEIAREEAIVVRKKRTPEVSGLTPGVEPRRGYFFFFFAAFFVAKTLTSLRD